MLLHAHSGFRYLVLLMALVVILYAAYGIATKREYDRQMRILSALLTASAFSAIGYSVTGGSETGNAGANELSTIEFRAHRSSVDAAR